MRRPFVCLFLLSQSLLYIVFVLARKMCVCANEIGSMNYWFMERKYVRSKKHTQDKTESTNTRIDLFGCHLFWPSSILSKSLGVANKNQYHHQKSYFQWIEIFFQHFNRIITFEFSSHAEKCNYVHAVFLCASDFLEKFSWQ